MNRLTAYCFTLILSVHFFITSGQPHKSKISLADVVESNKFSQRSIDEIRSMQDGEYYTIFDTYKNIIRYSYATGMPVDTVFSIKYIEGKKIGNISEYQFNRQETSLLLTTDEEALYRHSFIANYWIYNCLDKSLIPLSQKGKQQLASFSPDGNKVAFVRENNIFIKELQSGKEMQITTDGKLNEVINGRPDWVYEEEFEFTKAYEWSPDSKFLAYMRFDESKVKMATIPFYEDLYPYEFNYKYPKAGEANSLVSIWTYDIATGKFCIMDVGDQSDQYIPRIIWTAQPNQLCIIRLNRLQNKVDVLIDNIFDGKSVLLYSETNKYFIREISTSYITFLEDGKHFLIFSERNGYNHLYLYSMDGKLVRQVTNGNFDVDILLGVDEKKSILYFTSCEKSPLTRMVYSIGLDGNGKKILSEHDGTNLAEFSKTFSYYTNTWSDINTPPVITLNKTNGTKVRVLVDNHTLKEVTSLYDFARTNLIKVLSDSFLLNGFIIKPIDFDSTRKYPLFIYVYGGPDSQEVRNKWNAAGNMTSNWFQYLVQQGYIVACIDNRGTDGRGETFRKCTYLQLGKLETRDQINSARYFSTLPYIDGKRIGIFGWSYGGYMSSLCMTRGNGTFKIGIAVAPVTNWRYYDNIYTERYMRTPQENPSGYDLNSPITYADSLKGNFLLIHGSADDNVHFQNTMMFCEKLIQANKKFELAIYPNKNHGIYGGNTRMHLYSKMTDFILSNL